MNDLQARLQAALADTYRLEKELGGGGMSRVFLAEEVGLGRKVVVKVLPPEMSAGVSAERFQREIQLAARLQHPHVVPLLTAGAKDDLLFYVMPFIKGESLRARLAREGELPVAEAARILRDVADALAYAHGEGVVHRDIKPDNVLLSGNHAVVTDFGVAKAVSASTGEVSLTSLGVALGTPAYMAPEQAAADPHVDHRADIYACGALAYEILTGRPPFNAPTPQMVLAAHVTQTPEPVTQHRASVPPVLAEIVMRCLAKKPADRWQRAEDLRIQLEGVMTPTGGMTPTATQPVAAVDYDAQARKAHPARVAVLFAIAAAGVLGIVYLLARFVGLPGWVMWAAGVLLLAGLPIVLLTGRQERRRAQAMVTGLHMPTPTGLQPHFTWRKAVLGGVLAFLGLAAAAGGYLAMRNLGIGPVGTLVASGVLAAGEEMVLADFSERVGDSSLARTVTEAIRVDLSQSSAVRLISPNRIREALQRMERDSDAPVTPELAREIANRDGLKAVLTGEVSSVGGGYVLTAQLLSAETGDVLTAQRATAADSTKLIAAMDELSAGLRERIGESLRSINAREPLLWATTASLPALRRFTDANRAINAGDQHRGIALLREAVALDSTFAEAYRKLAIELSNAGIAPRERLDAISRAFRYRARLPEATRYLVEGTYHAQVTEDGPASIRAYQTVLDVTPDNATALNNLAVQLYGDRDFAGALDYAERAVASRPEDVLMRMNREVALIALGRLDSAVVEQRRMDSLAPGHIFTRYGGIFLGSQQRDWDAVRRYAGLAPGGSPSDPATLTMWRAGADASEGRLAAAERGLREGEDLARAAGLDALALDLAFNRARLASAVRGDGAAARAVIAEALARTPLDSLDVLERPYAGAAEAFARAGDPAEARRILARMDGEFPADRRLTSYREAEGFATALLALEEGRIPEAVAGFRAATAKGACLLCGLPDLAEAFAQAGAPDSAIATATRYVETPHFWRSQVDPWFLAPTLFRLGELHEARGDTAKAVEYYGQFAELWKDADPELQPRVKEARARIARLTLR
jgi:tRNA A-37 threonylcarbamoyl transferase component Bud32/tetratricopeptide (TPR) repeat protein